MSYKSYTLLSILILAAVLRLWGLGGPDVVTDEAINSFRAYGLVDFLSTEFQTTPMEWLQAPIWWLGLSFHDHPLGSFFVQHVFFRLFGDSVTVMRLPFALFGILSVWLVYAVVRELGRASVVRGGKVWDKSDRFDRSDKSDNYLVERIAQVSAAVMAVGSLSVWISRIALQESMVVALGLLIVWLGVRAMREPKNWYWFGLALGIGMMTKYTVVVYWFILFIVLLIYSRKSLRLKEFWFAHVIALMIFTPVILYNAGLYREFGHFDLQFSYILGQHVPQWTLLPGKPVGSIAERFLDLWKELGRAMSPVMIAFAGAGAVWAVYRLLTQRERVISRIGQISPIGRVGLIGLMGLAGTTGLISVMGPGARFLPMIMPWAAMIFAAFISDMGKRARGRAGKIWMAACVFALVYELGFSVNSHLFTFPVGPLPWTHTQVLTQGSDWGYNELERYLHEKFDNGVTTLRLQSKSPLVGAVTDRYFEPRRQRELKPLATLLVYDVNINWFPRVWYLNRRALYQGLPVVTADDFLKVVQEQREDYYRDAGFEEFVFIKAEDTFRATTIRSDAAMQLGHALEERGSMPMEIRRETGDVAFKVYEFR